MTTDLFSEAPIPGDSLDSQLGEKLLEQAFAASGRKTALKGMDPVLRTKLAAAAATVARTKRHAYDRAFAGERIETFGHLSVDTEVNRAVAALNEALVDICTIPMAP